MCDVRHIDSVGFYPAMPCSAWWPGDPRPWWHYASTWGGDRFFPLARRRDRDEEWRDERDAARERARDEADRYAREPLYDYE